MTMTARSRILRAPFACEPLSRRLLLAAGDPDLAFSSDGRTELNFPGVAFSIRDTAVAPDGKIILGGIRGPDYMAVARLNADGTVDTTFGDGGLYETNRRDDLTSVAVQGDGKIIIGLGRASDDENRPLDLHIGRILADGSGFDPGFGSNGIAHVGDRWGFSNIADVAVQRDGKVIGAGSVRTGSVFLDSDFAVVRYNASGTIDTTFGGGDGVSEHGFGDSEGITGVTIDYNGNSTTNPLYGTIVAAGGEGGGGPTAAPSRFQVLRLRPDGLPDPTFDGDGKLTSPNLSGAGHEIARDVVVQPGGRIVVAGSARETVNYFGNFLVARYTSAGALDGSFGLAGGGVTELDLGANDNAQAITLGYHNTVGNLLVGGSHNGRLAVVALKPDGQLDTRFSGDGILTTNILGFGTGLFATGSLVAPARKLVIAGGNSANVARYIDVGSLVTVGTFQPQMYEQGQQATSFIVARTQALPIAETVSLGTFGTATTRGANRDFNGTNILFGIPNFSATTVVIPAGQTFVNVVLTPIDDALVEGDETIGFVVGTTVTYDAGSPGDTTLVVRDNDTTAGPVVNASAFAYETAPQRLRFSFSQSVAASISAADFQVTGPAGMPGTTFSYDDVTNTATLSFNGILPDGGYSARAIAAGITNATGQPMPADHTLDFLFLSGDANRDRRVDLEDFNILAANFGQSNRTFSQGDFNYDGTVNLQDFNILASRFGASVAPASVGGRHGGAIPPGAGGVTALNGGEGFSDELADLLG